MIDQLAAAADNPTNKAKRKRAPQKVEAKREG